MVEINGITQSKGLAPDGVSGYRSAERSEAPVNAGDAAQFSDTAAVRVEAARLLRLAAEAPDVREDLVEQARRDLVEGAYRVQEVVEQVAARLTRFVG